MKNELPHLDADVNFDKDVLGCLPIIIAAVLMWGIIGGTVGFCVWFQS